MAKQIGKGKVVSIGMDDGTIESDCLNGSSVTKVNYVFDLSETDDELEVDDMVLFVEDVAPGEGEGTAVNVVKVPTNGCV